MLHAVMCKWQFSIAVVWMGLGKRLENVSVEQECFRRIVEGTCISVMDGA